MFAPYSIVELAGKLLRGESASFTMRYRATHDRRHAMNMLDNWDPQSRPRRSEQILRGSLTPAMRCYFNTQWALRAMLKIAFNLLAHCCQETPVDRRSFPEVVSLITGRTQLTVEHLSKNGFVWAADLANLAEPNSHCFRLIHDRDRWTVFSSFFGGEVGTVVQFIGPNRERWSHAHVVAPIRSDKWSVNTGNIALPPSVVHFDWHNPSLVIPAAKIRWAQHSPRI